ncbi:hypothetical protein [Bacillus altitudinis]|uniref:hypothetical protein n=1 Tax=Bacillus altitudinis TaxID=293387 RepID=UPI002ACE5D04|nr:hypothetical protein [Bacillus altitudinis]WQH37847.1 hypothetical protein U2873_13545 [Bacillus altitudinis]
MPWNDIWQADMNGSGLLPLIKNRSDKELNNSKGYIVVDLNPYEESESDKDLSERKEINVLADPHFVNKKSYDLITKLLDNYNLNASEREVFEPDEIKEVNEFLNYASNTETMQVAKKYLEENNYIKAGISNDEWIDMLYNVWFEPRRNGTTSVFEHVFVGEKDSKKRKNILGGQHFWYQYLLHEGPFDKIERDDKIFFLKTVQVQLQEISNYAEVITISYRYVAKDKYHPNSTELIKKIGGFFVGLSAEGLLALGTAAYFISAPKDSNRCGDIVKDIPIKINEETYNLKVVLKCDEGKTFFRTFYPMIIS